MLRQSIALAILAIAGVHHASAAPLCGPVPAVRFVDDTGPYHSRSAGPAHCRPAELRFHARSAEPLRPATPQRYAAKPVTKPAAVRDVACRRYPNLC